MKMITSETKIVSGKDEFSEIVAVNEIHLKQLQKLMVKMDEYFNIHNKEKFDLLSCKDKLSDRSSLLWSFTEEKFLVFEGDTIKNQLAIKLMDGDYYNLSDALFFWEVGKKIRQTLEELKRICFQIANISSLTDDEIKVLFLDYIKFIVNKDNFTANSWSMFAKMVNEPLLKFLLIRMHQIDSGFNFVNRYSREKLNLTNALFCLEQVRRGNEK